MKQPKLFLLYHFFHPDEVVSARLFSDLAQDMTGQGWQVEAMPAARLFDSNRPLARREQWQGVTIHRIWRPAFKQASNFGRIFNALFMLCAWSWRALRTRRASQEVVVIGTDPILSVLVAIPWRIFRPRIRIIHWCHDLHPEASLAEGTLQRTSLIVRALQWMMQRAYRRCHTIVDLGPCMRHLLQQDCGPASAQSPGFATITPWALVEPETVAIPDPEVRRELFGDCRLALLYSGNLGRAHEFDLFLKLAESTQSDGVQFCFAGRGARMSELRSVTAGNNIPIRFADFASENQLNKRLAAGDVHLVSLKDNWTGTVVPSKFFGALAIGRPVLFIGSEECAIARWITTHRVGWHLTDSNVSQIAAELRALSVRPEQLEELNQHCQQVYRQEFSKHQQLKRWNSLLSASSGI